MAPTHKLVTICTVIFLKYCLCFPVVEIRGVKLRFFDSKTISSSASLLLPFYCTLNLMQQCFDQAYHYTLALLQYKTILHGKHCLNIISKN